jgi:hypothetical protein
VTEALTAELASRLATMALSHVAREYPNKLDHVMGSAADVRGPRALHPIFYGSFDWHSCVHGYWTLCRIYRRMPHMAETARIRETVDAHITPENVAAELAYLRRKESAGFERPYGWGWLLMLQAELERHESPEGRRWAATMRPLAHVFAERFTTFLPKATYPVRVGTHPNTAFALSLALDYATVAADGALARLIRDKLRTWHAGDRDAQAWEPSGDDFLSSTLMVAEAMRRALNPDAFAPWFDAFLPRLGSRQPATLFAPAVVSDRSDGKIVHLEGLNLSRAWCWRRLAGALDEDDPRRKVALEAAATHLAASLPHLAGDYMAEHWLASFALLALDE